MELNWAPQNRWQRHNRGTADPLAPYAAPAPVAPGHAPAEPEETTTGNGFEEWPVPTGRTGPENEPPESEPLGGRRRGGSSPLSWLRKVSFRSRISILVGVAVGIAVAMASLVSYIAVSRQLEGQVTSNLEDAVAAVPGVHLIPNSTVRLLRASTSR